MLLHRDSAADRGRGLEIVLRAREWQRERMPSLVATSELLAAVRATLTVTPSITCS